MGIESKVIRILIAEPDPDLRTVYARYLKSLPVDVETVTGGGECLEKALLASNGKSYDMIIVDTHLKDANGLHIAKKILEEKPLQDIVFTTTWDLETLRSDFNGYSIDMEKYAVIRKPFRFSDLLGHIKPAKYKIGV
jgi:DNA-binding response OmpR family regulator